MSEPCDAANEAGGRWHKSPLVNSGAWGQSFPSTLWTRIERAQEGDQGAIGDLVRRYGTPVFCYFRAHGMERETAQDLTQDFFVKLASGQFFKHLKTRVFRFRSFLKRSLANMLFDFFRRMESDKRKPEGGLACLDHILEGAPDWEPGSGESPEAVLDREYALALLSAVILRVLSECEQDGLQDHFGCFANQFLTDPPLGWAEAGARYGLSAKTARERARTVQARFQKALIEEIRAPDMTEAEVADEIENLIQAFRRSPKRHW